jgi:hypothetical protein
MTSVMVGWTGTCPNMAKRMALIGYLQTLAETAAGLNHSPECNRLWGWDDGEYRPETRHGIPRIRVFDTDLTGDILLWPGLVPDSQFPRLCERIRRKKRHMVVMHPELIHDMGEFSHTSDKSRRCLLRLSRLRVFGIDFELPFVIYPRERRISFVFLESHDLPALTGCVAMLNNHDQCDAYEDEVIRSADWFISAPQIHLRYALEDWTDFLLGWIKYFFMPDLEYYSRSEWDSHARLGLWFDRQCREKGRNETMWDGFRILDTFDDRLNDPLKSNLGGSYPDEYKQHPDEYQQHIKVLLDPKSSEDTLYQALSELAGNSNKLSEDEVNQLFEATDRLVSFLSGDNGVSQWDVAKLLGRIGPPALPSLRKLFSAVSDNMNQCVLEALTACGGESDVIEVLNASPSEDARRIAVHALEYGRLDAVAPVFLRLIQDANEWARQSAAYFLFDHMSMYTCEYWDQYVDILDALFSTVRLDEFHSYKRHQRWPWSFGFDMLLRNVLRLVLSPLSSCSVEARLKAARVCGDMSYVPGDTRLVEALEDCARRDPDWDVRIEARASLKKRGDKERYYSYQVKDLLK